MKGFIFVGLDRFFFKCSVIVMFALTLNVLFQCNVRRNEKLQPVKKEKTNQIGYNSPADFAKDTTVSELRRMYFKKVFHYDD
jgi:hypothetical protein